MGRSGRSLSAVLGLMAGAACASAPTRPAPVLSPEVAWGLVHFVQALNDPARTRFAGWSKRLVQRDSEPKLRRKLADMHQQLGDCELKEVLEITGPRGARAELRCARGIIKIQWTVAAAPPHDLETLGAHDGFFVQPH